MNTQIEDDFTRTCAAQAEEQMAALMARLARAPMTTGELSLTCDHIADLQQWLGHLSNHLMNRSEIEAAKLREQFPDFVKAVAMNVA